MTNEESLGEIPVQCPTCGTSRVKYEEAIEELAGPFECVRCGRAFSRDELLAENMENIELHASELARPLVEKKLKQWKMDLKRALKGNKHIRIR